MIFLSGRFVKRKSIPAGHWQIIVDSLGHQDLMKINDSMQLEPWIAEGYELVDDLTWKITLKDGVCFSNGKPCDAEAVKKCLEDLVAVHERAAGDLKIDSMEADGLEIGRAHV